MSINTNNFVSPLMETDRLILKTGIFEDYLKVYEYDMTKLTNVTGEIEFVKQSAEDIEKKFILLIEIVYLIGLFT